MAKNGRWITRYERQKLSVNQFSDWSCNDVNNVDLVFHLLQIDTCEMVSELNRMRLRA